MRFSCSSCAAGDSERLAAFRRIRTVSSQYNAAGIILYKSDVGIYYYGAQGPGHAHPHALQSVAGAYGTNSLYDNNGNLTNASGGKYRRAGQGGC